MKPNSSPSTSNAPPDIYRSFMTKANAYPLLSAQQEKELGARVQRGDAAAREKLICSNFRLVVRIAFNYQDRGMDFMDLIQNGNIGLMKAAEKFNPNEFDTRFSSYASYWIKNEISYALLTNPSPLRLPVKFRAALNRITRAAVQLEQELCRRPTLEEIATLLSISVATITSLLQGKLYADSISLSDPLHSEYDGLTVQDTLASPTMMADDVAHFRDTHERITLALDDLLGERSARIFRQHIGFDFDADSQNFQEIGETEQLSRERIRQIQSVSQRTVRQQILSGEFAGIIPLEEVNLWLANGDNAS